MLSMLVFSGVPIDDSATIFRAGLVAKLMAQKGNKVLFISVSGCFEKQIIRDIDGLKVIFIGQGHYKTNKRFSTRERLGFARVLIENIKTCIRFTSILRLCKPDRVLVVSSMPVSYMVGSVARVLGFKTIIDIEDYAAGQMESSGYPKLMVNIYKWIERSALKIFNKVIVPSEYLKKKYRGCVLIPNMIDLGFWRTEKVKREEREKRIVFVGLIGKYHGQMEVLEGLSGLLRRNKNINLCFVGGGEFLENLVAEIKMKGLESRVTLTGHVSQEEVRKIIKASDFGILPLWNKPVHLARHPLKLLEYLATGLIVIAGRVGEAEKIIKDGYNGVLCPPGDIESMGAAIEKVIKDNELTKKLKERAVSSVKDFSVEKIFPLWLDVLTS